MILSVISFVFVFAIVTITHELGHYFAARRAGIRVYEFAIGFGPRIFSFKKSSTTFGLNAIPLGGFVRLAGIEGRAHEEAACPEEEKYYNKTPAKKFLSIVMGPLMNIFLAFFLLSVLFMFTGVPTGVSNEIASISLGSEAERVGLKPGDKIEEIGGAKITDMAKAIGLIHGSAGKELVLKIKRGEKSFIVVAIPRMDPKMKVGLIGFSPKSIVERVGLIGSVAYGAAQTGQMVLLIAYFIWLLFSGGASLFDIAGPIGIAHFTGQAAQSGLVTLMSFTAFLSVNLGVVNLLPIPALDGGRLVFVVLEWIRKKPLPIEKENKFHYVGLALLLSLFVVLTINDVIRIIRN